MQSTSNAVGISAGSRLIAAGGGASFDVGGAHFDGTNDLLSTSSGTLTDLSRIAVSFWFRRAGGLGSIQYIFWCNSNRFYAQLHSGNTLRVAGRSTANANVCHWIFDAITDTNWHHAFVYMDGIDSSNSFGYLDGAANGSAAGLSNATINSGQSTWRVGDSTSFKFNGDLAQLYWADPGRTVTTSDVSKFIASDVPVQLGANGSTPFGTAAQVMLGDEFGSFETNGGTGGTLSVTGALTAPTTPISL